MSAGTNVGTAANGIGWFEIGTDDPQAAERFYGDVFGWTFAHQAAESTDPAYRVITTGAAGGLRGGLFATRGAVPSYAVFTVLVEDVVESCRGAAQAGGSVLVEPMTNEAGVTFAHLLDPAGNHFAVFTPPAPRA